ncbi:hypothetical protein EDD21DRAFT_374495 [Dissophora ornata]|nr:hypothetical protein EDD21DRAFT_374495 [Dissophora ornata]
MSRSKINVAELGGRQMLPLEPRPILAPTLDDSTMTPMAQFSSIVEILRFRGMFEPDATAFTVVDNNNITNKGRKNSGPPSPVSSSPLPSPLSPPPSPLSSSSSSSTSSSSWTWDRLLGRAEKICRAILSKTPLRRGARVALVYRKSEILDFMAAFYGCMMAGMTAVPINVIEEFAEMTYILGHTQTELALTTEYNYKALTRDLGAHRGRRSSTTSTTTATTTSEMDWPEGVTWWKTDTLGDNWRLKIRKDSTGSASSSGSGSGPEIVVLPDLAYIEFTKSPNGELKGVAVSHRTILSQCHTIKHALGSNPKRGRRRNSTASVDTIGSSNNQRNRISTSLPLGLSVGSRTASTPKSTAVPEGTSKDVVMSWLEPRQQVGLILGGLLGVYRGSHTVFAHGGITETPGLWEACAQRYQVTMAIGEYEGVRELIQGHRKQQESQPPYLLSSLDTFLINTVVVQPKLDWRFANEFLTPMGVAMAEEVVVPFCSLSEHGGMILSMRDHLKFPRGADLIDFGFEYDVPRASETGRMRSQPRRRPRGHSTSSNAICHYLLDRKALKNNIIEVVATGNEAIQRKAECGFILVGAFGYATPRATLAIVDPETTALCQPNRVGEIWIDSPSVAFGFWELPKHSQSIFHALPLIVPVDTMVPEAYDPVPAGFLRTGLLGGLIEGRVVIFGLHEDRIQQAVSPDLGTVGVRGIAQYACHYSTDLAKTIMDRIIGFNACVAFEMLINNERLPVICAESPKHHRSDLVKLAAFAKQAMEDYHDLRPYCIAIAPPGTLPRAFKNGKRIVHQILCRKMLESGRLTLSHLWTSVDDTVFNLAIGDDTQGGIWGLDALAIRDAALPAHARTIQFSSSKYPLEVFDGVTKTNLSQFSSLAELLVWRTIMNAEEVAFLGSDHHHQSSSGSSKRDSAKPLTFRKFGMKVVSIANYIEKKGGFKAGDKVVLLFPNGVEFAATVYATWFLGLVPIPIVVPDPSRLHEDVMMLMGLLSELRLSHLIGNSLTEEIMKQRTTMIHIKAFIGARQDIVVPTVFNVSKAPKAGKALGKESGYSSPPRASLTRTAPAVVYVHYSTDMRRTLVKVSHGSLLAQCRAQKVQYRLKSRKPIISCWKTFSGIGLLQSCALGVYAGAPTVQIRYTDFLATPQIYFEAIERHGARDALVDYSMLEQVLAAQDPHAPPTNFAAMRNFLINAEGRPRTEVHRALERRLCRPSSKSSSTGAGGGGGGFQMDRTQICSMFGHMTNPLVTTRSYMNVEPVRLHLSLKSLRRGIVEVTTEKDDPTGIWVEDSGIPACGTTVTIVNPETREICLSSEIGEIWVSSESNVQAYTGAISPLIVEADPDSMSSLMEINAARFSATIAAGDNSYNNSESARSSPNCSFSSIEDHVSRNGSAMRYVRTGEVGFLWNYADENFNGGRATSLLFVLGPIAETFEVNGLMHFPADIEATIERAHPNIAPSGSIVFQADQAVVCVIQARQTDTSTVNLVLSVMHAVVEKHQFMPDVIAVVGDGVLAKNQYGEKQRGKMLSLFMGAKMPLLFIHYPRGCLPQSMPDQTPEGDKQQALSRKPSRSPERSPTTPITSSRPISSCSCTSSSSLSSLSSAKGILAEAETGAGDEGSSKKNSGSRSNRSSISMSGSMLSVHSVRSFVGSMFQHNKGDDRCNSNSSVSINSASLTSFKGMQSSRSESGLTTLSASPFPVGSSSKLNSAPLPLPSIDTTPARRTRSVSNQGAESRPLSACSTKSAEASVVGRRVMIITPLGPLTPISPYDNRL